MQAGVAMTLTLSVWIGSGRDNAQIRQLEHIAGNRATSVGSTVMMNAGIGSKMDSVIIQRWEPTVKNLAVSVNIAINVWSLSVMDSVNRTRMLKHTVSNHAISVETVTNVRNGKNLVNANGIRLP